MKDIYPAWQHWPRNHAPEPLVVEVVGVFREHREHIDSRGRRGNENRLSSNQVLEHVADDLCAIEGMKVERKIEDKVQRIDRPVLYGPNGSVTKAFAPDAYHSDLGLVIEVEAGMTIPNNVAYKKLKRLGID